MSMVVAMGADDGESGGGAGGAGQRGGEGVTEMQAGRELDALVARRVFGKEIGWVEGYINHNPTLVREPVTIEFGKTETRDVPLYSTDVAAAWQIMEHFQADGGEWDMEMSGNTYTFTLYRKHRFSVCGEAETAPLAICRAALQCVKGGATT